MITLTCTICETQKEVYPSQIKGSCARYKLRGGYYFCRPCWNENKKELGVFFGTQRKKGVRIKLTCSDCGATQWATPSIAKAFTGYCAACSQKRRNKKVPVACPDCGVVRSVKKSAAMRMSGYCKKCARRGSRSSQWTGGLVSICCTHCGKPKKVKKSMRDNKKDNYMCINCVSEKRKAELNPAWKGGLSFLPYPPTWTEMLRQAIRNRDNNVCVLCVPGAQGRRLCVHHIDYDKSNCSPDNLITLCLSCHTKTNFNRDYWKVLFTETILPKEVSA